MSPFLVDVLGNVFDLYDAITWWDDLNHFVNWALLCLAIGQLVLRFVLPRIETFVIVVGFGAFAAIVAGLATATILNRRWRAREGAAREVGALS